ncbi:MAG TPA: MFS transporter [Edaphocola sp.]|nr:MFS transporter [Edaphocola sp.]
MNIKNVSTFRAFRSEDYTLYFFGKSISQFGTWMQRTAVVWLVYSITHSAFMLGLTIFAEQFPSFLLSAFGGVAADRHSRFKIINITQIAAMVQAILLAVLVITKHYVVWEILVLSIILGIINAYDVPARQSLINELVEDSADLPNALSLSAAMASLAKLLGPAAAGIILSQFGAATCFLANAASFGGVMLSIALMKTDKTKVFKKEKKNILKELAEGFVYLRREASLGFVIVMLSITGLLILPYDTLIPVFAKVIFKGDAATYGYISGFIGLGTVAGTVLLASLKNSAPMRKILVLSTAVLSIGLVGFSYTSNFPLAMFFAVITGFGGVAQFTTCNIIVQSEAAPEMRGRAISILITALFGMVPLGSLLVGAVSQWIGAPGTLLSEGIIGIITTIAFARILKKKNRKPVALQAGRYTDETLLKEI